MFKQFTKIVGLTITLFVLTTIVNNSFNCALAATPSLWIGNMFPAGGLENNIANAQPFHIYVQAYKEGVIDRPRQGSNIACTLLWSEVEEFGGTWKKPAETTMSYNGDKGNNDEYKATISPNPGKYEFTANCTDLADSTTIWQEGNNGKINVSADRRALWLDKNIVAWNSYGSATYELHYDTTGNLTVPSKSGSGIPLSFDDKVKENSYSKFPNINGYDKWRIPENSSAQIPDIVKSEGVWSKVVGGSKRRSLHSSPPPT